MFRDGAKKNGSLYVYKHMANTFVRTQDGAYINVKNLHNYVYGANLRCVVSLSDAKFSKVANLRGSNPHLSSFFFFLLPSFFFLQPA